MTKDDFYIYFNFDLEPILLPTILNRRIRRSSLIIAPMILYQKAEPTWNSILIRICFLLKFHRSNIKWATVNSSEGGNSGMWVEGGKSN